MDQNRTPTNYLNNPTMFPTSFSSNSRMRWISFLLSFFFPGSEKNFLSFLSKLYRNEVAQCHRHCHCHCFQEDVKRVSRILRNSLCFERLFIKFVFVFCNNLLIKRFNPLSWSLKLTVRCVRERERLGHAVNASTVYFFASNIFQGCINYSEL